MNTLEQELVKILENLNALDPDTGVTSARLTQITGIPLDLMRRFLQACIRMETSRIRKVPMENCYYLTSITELIEA